MVVEDILDEVKEVCGDICDNTQAFRAITRGIELLSNKGLFDPLIGYIEFSLDGSYFVSLPRDVKTPIKININNNPSFTRGRLFEFTLNTNGSEDGEELGWSWSDRGYSCLSNEKKLPSRLKYVCLSSTDNGLACTAKGIDNSGREIEEELIASSTSAALSTNTFAEVRKVLRAASTSECFLVADAGNVARYYPNETEPEYRVIKLSKSAVNVRMMYRRHTFKITSTQDVIPLHSAMAVIQAVKAVRLLQKEEYEKAAAALALSEQFINEEQKSRSEGLQMSQNTEVSTAINSNVTTADSIIVADIYDEASTIFGAIGREKLFDKITDAVSALENKALWDSTIGYVDIFKAENLLEVNPNGSLPGNGLFVLPRYVDTVLGININGRVGSPRNRWFEFHLNGTRERSLSPHGNWDDLGYTPIINGIPLNPLALANNRKPIPTLIGAIPLSSGDNDAEIRVYGEEIFEGIQRPVLGDDGKPGYIVTCKADPDQIAEDYATTAPKFVRITRITKKKSNSFIRLVELKPTVLEDQSVIYNQGILFGYYYPDETEPNYRVIKIPSRNAVRARIRYRKQSNRVSSLYDPLNLKSRLAIINMLRAIKAQESDVQAAALYEQLAENYLNEQQNASNPFGGSIQVESSIMPSVTSNVV